MTQQKHRNVEVVVSLINICHTYIKIERGNGVCVNNPTIEQTTAEGHQWEFIVARNSRTRSCLSAGPLKICILVQ